MGVKLVGLKFFTATAGGYKGGGSGGIKYGNHITEFRFSMDSLISIKGLGLC